ncbi:hypothetical protein PA08_2471 [Cutibacterium modestum P08]|nr:hypothetical protein PA08_2471 [Cutibacterium modestum P08]
MPPCVGIFRTRWWLRFRVFMRQPENPLGHRELEVPFKLPRFRLV